MRAASSMMEYSVPVAGCLTLEMEDSGSGCDDSVAHPMPHSKVQLGLQSPSLHYTTLNFGKSAFSGASEMGQSFFPKCRKTLPILPLFTAVLFTAVLSVCLQHWVRLPVCSLGHSSPPTGETMEMPGEASQAALIFTQGGLGFAAWFKLLRCQNYWISLWNQNKAAVPESRQTNSGYNSFQKLKEIAPWSNYKGLNNILPGLR